MKKIDVILTTYNSSKFILSVVNSIIHQKGNGEVFNINLIIVDDCSKDSTTDILLRNNIPFFKTKQNTGGPNYGRNIALKKCNGDYICIADHDDVWMPHKILRLLDFIHLAPIITSGYFLLDHTTGITTEIVNKKSKGREYAIYNTNETFLDKLSKRKGGQLTYLGSIMFDSSLKKILFEETYGMVDFDWILKLFHNRNSVEIFEPLYHRKVQSSNLSLNEKYRKNDYYLSLKVVKTYSKTYPKLVSKSVKRINGTLARFYYLIGNMSLSRKYFLKSSMNIKTILYLFTTFVGSNFVKKHFKIFG